MNLLSRFIFIFLGLVVVLSLFAIFFYRPITVKTSKSVVVIGNHEFDVDIAKTEKEREQGLSGRAKLSTGSGMLFLFPFAGLHGFWMRDMKFPIDIVWISKNKVVGFTENVDPQIGAKLLDLEIYYPPKIVDTVLEINAGEVKRLGLKVGEQFDLKQ